MPRKLLRKVLPDPHRIREIESLKFLGDKLHRPNLWHVNRRSVANAMACGLFAMYTPPLPWQMVIAAILAIYFNANLPIAVALVWVTNPVTWIPMYYFAYWLGAELLGKAPFEFSAFSQLFSLEAAWDLGAPLLVGCGVLMVTGAVAGYFGTHALWRRDVRRRWEERRLRRLGQYVPPEPGPVRVALTRAVCRAHAFWVSPGCTAARERWMRHAEDLWRKTRPVAHHLVLVTERVFWRVVDEVGTRLERRIRTARSSGSGTGVTQSTPTPASRRTRESKARGGSVAPPGA